MLKSIIYVTPGFPVGGAEKFVILLSKELVADTREQIIVSLSNNNKLQAELDPSVRFLAIPRLSKFNLKPMRQFRRLVQNEGADILFCINFFSYFFTRLATLGLKNKPRVLISYHSTVHVSKKEHRLHKFYYRLLTKRDHIITVSKNQFEYTVENYPVPVKYFTTIQNGIDTNHWRLPENPEAAKALRLTFGVPAEALLIVMTAAFRPEKNHFGAVRALKLLHAKYNSQAYLLFVGGGVLMDATKKFVEAEGMTKYIRFAGQQPDVRPFYWAANLFTLCSDSVETFSIAALESMGCGLPGVLTNIGGASEMIGPVNGLLCEVRDEDIAEKWNHALHTNYSPADIHGYAAEHFNADKMVAAYKNILELR